MVSMKRIDYKIFVPRGYQNYVRFDEEEFLISTILTVNLHLEDDKITYWFYFKIPSDDEKRKYILHKQKEPSMILLLGNNPYEIHGTAKVENMSSHKWEEKIEVAISFIVLNASNTINNPRKEVEINRCEILDLD